MYLVPSEIKARGPRAKLAYENALKTGKVKVYRARIMLIGQDRAGKTSLKKSFLGLPFDPEEDSTDGIEVDPTKFEVDIDQVKNWKRTDEKLSVSQFASDLAKMVAREIQGDKDESDNDYEYEREKQKEDESKLDLAQKRKKQTKIDQVGDRESIKLTNFKANKAGKKIKKTETNFSYSNRSGNKQFTSVAMLLTSIAIIRQSYFYVEQFLSMSNLLGLQ